MCLYSIFILVNLTNLLYTTAENIEINMLLNYYRAFSSEFYLQGVTSKFVFQIVIYEHYREYMKVTIRTFCVLSLSFL